MPQTQEQPGGETPPAVLKPVDVLAAEITAARQKQLESKIGAPYNREILWFGDIHSCDRHNYYSMVEGSQRLRWDSFVQAKLDAGKEWELLIKKELLSLGYEPLLANETVEIKNKHGRVLARGKTDLSLADPSDRRKHYPVEIKCMQTHMFSAINSWKDLLRNPWTEKYLRQLMLYLYGKNIDQGLFLLNDFQGHWKLIPVYLDYAMCEDILQKIETAIAGRESGVAPNRIPYDNALCGRCQFASVCIPDIKMAGIDEIGNENTAALLERRDALKEKASEYTKIDKTIRELFKDIKDGSFKIGNFIVSRKGISKTKYDIPDDVKEKFAQQGIEYRNKIERFAKPDPENVFLEPKRFVSFDEEI